MSIAQQIATPTAPAPTRLPGGPLRRQPRPRPGFALVRIAGLIAVTALGAALIAGAAALAIVTIAANATG